MTYTIQRSGRRVGTEWLVRDDGSLLRLRAGNQVAELSEAEAARAAQLPYTDVCAVPEPQVAPQKVASRKPVFAKAKKATPRKKKG